MHYGERDDFGTTDLVAALGHGELYLDTDCVPRRRMKTRVVVRREGPTRSRRLRTEKHLTKDVACPSHFSDNTLAHGETGATITEAAALGRLGEEGPHRHAATRCRGR